ncbi:MAG: ParB/RepB/Spo0J family partition protein [Candidatus Marsarchaeota archaeon]|nr:ParB/RepB/Spo0J family partition protein [Candidatus Marsarchaeota archaeon]
MHRSNEMPQIIREVGFGFNWSSKKVWKLDIPVTGMQMSELQWHFNIPFWNKPGGYYDLKPNEVMENPETYKAEYDRVIGSDLKHPIDVMQNKGRWLILDGLHRLAKAKLLGMDTVKVRRIPRSKIPKIQI